MDPLWSDMDHASSAAAAGGRTPAAATAAVTAGGAADATGPADVSRAVEVISSSTAAASTVHLDLPLAPISSPPAAAQRPRPPEQQSDAGPVLEPLSPRWLLFFRSPEPSEGEAAAEVEDLLRDLGRFRLADRDTTLWRVSLAPTPGEVQSGGAAAAVAAVVGAAIAAGLQQEDDEQSMIQQASAFEGATEIALVRRWRRPESDSGASLTGTPASAGGGGEEDGGSRKGRGRRRWGSVGGGVQEESEGSAHGSSRGGGSVHNGAGSSRRGGAAAVAFGVSLGLFGGSGQSDANDSEGTEEIGGSLGSLGGGSAGDESVNVLQITLEDGIKLEVELDSGEQRLQELGYAQQLERCLTLKDLLAFGLNSTTIFVGPFYSLQLRRPCGSGVVLVDCGRVCTHALRFAR